MNNSNRFHLTYLKTRDNKKVSVLRATVWLDSSHPHKNCSPSPSFTGFLQHKTISQGHGNNDTEIQSIEIKHMKLTLITAKLCYLSKGSSLLFKTIQQSLITAIVHCSKGVQKAKEYNGDLLYYSARFNYMVFSSASRHLQFTTCLHQRTRNKDVLALEARHAREACAALFCGCCSRTDRFGGRWQANHLCKAIVFLLKL